MAWPHVGIDVSKRQPDVAIRGRPQGGWQDNPRSRHNPGSHPFGKTRPYTPIFLRMVVPPMTALRVQQCPREVGVDGNGGFGARACKTDPLWRGAAESSNGNASCTTGSLKPGRSIPQRKPAMAFPATIPRLHDIRAGGS